MVRRRTLAVMVVIVSGLAASGHAQSIAGTMTADLTIARSCAISGVVGTTGLDFGSLAFGTRPATFTGVLTAQVSTGGSATQVVCSPDVTSVTIIIGGGLNAGAGSGVGVGTRALNLAGTSFVPYAVYSTAGFTGAYPINGPGVTLSVPIAGTPFTLPIFGRINKTSALALPVGTYVDTLVVTMQF